MWKFEGDIIKPYYECGACYLRQVRELLDLSTDDENLKFELMNYTLGYLGENFDKGYSSNELASVFNQHIMRKTGCRDPYFREKIISTDVALSIMPAAESILAKNDSLETYVKLAIVGNILDFAVFDIDTDVEELINLELDKKLTINQINQFEEALNKHDEALYLVDNVGEILFDKLLIDKIKEYDVNVTVAAKESPIVNDACVSDALDAGFDNVVSIGSDSGGIVESMISDEFRQIFENSSFIISKGMANYEGITEMDLSKKDVFCLLCVKCNPISKDLGVDVGSHVLTQI